MTDLAAKLVAFCTTTGPSAILAAVQSFVLPPLAVWENVPVRTIAVLTAIFGAWVAFFHVKTKRRRLIRWVAALIVFICAVLSYNFLLNHDPQADHLSLHHAQAAVAFFLSFLLLGFCSAEAIRFLFPDFFAKKGATAVPKSCE